jgi:hypothetical protein
MADHLSTWHDFNAENRDTYPQVMDSPVQLRFVDGFSIDFESFRVFLQSKVFQNVPVVAWRYIKAPGR